MTEQGVIRVILADDHAMVREGLAQILQENARIRVVGQASDGLEAVEVTSRTEADVVLLDYSMPKLGGTHLLERLLKQDPRARILVLTVHESIHYAVRALEGGAHGYVIKSAAVQELVEAIEALHRGEIYISPALSQNVIHHLRRPKRERAGLDALSNREFELLQALGAGMGLKECTRYLGISSSTASTYRARLMEKLNLHSTAEIIRFALEHEIVG